MSKTIEERVEALEERNESLEVRSLALGYALESYQALTGARPNSETVVARAEFFASFLLGPHEEMVSVHPVEIVPTL